MSGRRVLKFLVLTQREICHYLIPGRRRVKSLHPAVTWYDILGQYCEQQETMASMSKRPTPFKALALRRFSTCLRLIIHFKIHLAGYTVSLLKKKHHYQSSNEEFIFSSISILLFDIFKTDIIEYYLLPNSTATKHE